MGSCIWWPGKRPQLSVLRTGRYSPALPRGRGWLILITGMDYLSLVVGVGIDKWTWKWIWL